MFTVAYGHEFLEQNGATYLVLCQIKIRNQESVSDKVLPTDEPAEVKFEQPLNTSVVSSGQPVYSNVCILG